MSSRESDPFSKSMRPAQAGILQRPVRFHLEGGGAAGGQVGVEGLGKLQIDRAAGGKVQLRGSPLSARLPWACRSVSSPVTCKRVEMDAVVGQRGMDAALALQMNAGRW